MDGIIDNLLSIYLVFDGLINKHSLFIYLVADQSAHTAVTARQCNSRLIDRLID